MRLMGYALGFASQILLARILGTRIYGEYVYLFTVMTYVGLLSRLGLEHSAIRDIPRYLQKGAHREARGLLRFTTILSTVLIASIAGPVLFLAANVPDKNVVVVIAAIASAFLSLSVVFNKQLIALSRPILSMYPDVIVRPAVIILVIGFMMVMGRSQLELRGAIALLGAAAFASAVFGGFLARRAVPNEVLNAPPRYLGFEWLATGRYFLLLLLLNLTINQSDRILLSWLAGNEYVGTFNAAARLAALTGLGLLVANTISAPLFARFSTSGDMQKMRAAIRTATRYAWLVGGSISIALVVGGEYALGLFGPDFVEARNVLLVLLIGQTISVFFGPVSHLLTMTGHHRVAASIIGAAALTNVLLNIWLIPIFGSMGAAVASAVSIAGWNAGMFIAVRVLVGVWGIRP